MSVQSNKAQSVSTGVMEDNYEYIWTIKNFLKVPKQGKLLESQKFEIRTGKNSPLQSRWVVGLKNSVDQSGIQCYHIYLELKDILSATGIDELECSITVEPRKSDGSGYWIETLKLNGKLKVNNCLEVPSSHWWKNSTNWNSALDVNGSLNIYINLALLMPHFESSVDGSNICTDFYEERFLMQSANIARKNFARLLLADSTEFDVKIVCSDGREFKCHSLILKANSSVFDSMLKPGFSESETGVIKMSDIAGRTMEAILQYLYTGELLPIWRAPDVITEFTYAAGKYEIADLVKFLDHMIGSVVSTSDSANLLALLDLANKMSLKKAEGQLKEQIAKLSISAGSSVGILALFQKE